MRKNKHILFIGFVVLIIVLAGTSNAESSRVAVIGFDSEDTDWIDDQEKEEKILEEIAWSFNDRLAQTDGYTVLDREQLLYLMEDINFRRGRSPFRSEIRQLRRYSNADIFIHGWLKQLEIEIAESFSLGPFHYSDVEITVDLGVDLIRSSTARVFANYSGRGQETTDGFRMRESSEEGESIGLSSEGETLQKAIDKAVEDLIANMVDDSEERTEPEERTIESEIVSIVGDRLVINKGSAAGLEVGQKGEIIRILRTEDESEQLQVIGEVEIIETDREGAFLETLQLNQEPQTGDKVVFSVEVAGSPGDTQVGDALEIMETRDFLIRINEAVKSGNRVTINGSARAKNDDVELKVILGNLDFYDHQGERRDMSGRKVSLGPWTNSSSNVASVTVDFQQGETKSLSWSFTGVPDEADSLARIQLWLETSREGEIDIDLRDLQL